VAHCDGETVRLVHPTSNYMVETFRYRNWTAYVTAYELAELEVPWGVSVAVRRLDGRGNVSKTIAAGPHEHKFERAEDAFAAGSRWARALIDEADAETAAWARFA
jgi:hypothetical protein